MTSHLYAIADAAGTIYPGSFRPTAEQARWAHAIEDERLRYPETRTYPLNWLDQQWPHYAERGDHVVRCRIETDEKVTVTQIGIDTSGQAGQS